MTESLPELIARRMAELQVSSLLALHKRLPEGGDSITYETVRNLANGKQRQTRDERVIRDMAKMLAVPEGSVRQAMGVNPSLGPWEMPARAQGLDVHEREIVVSVVDALLRAKRTGGTSDDGKSEAQKIPLTTRADVTTAARTVKESPGKRMAQESGMRGEESQDDGDWGPA